MKFRCCGNQAVLGHAADCSLKPEMAEVKNDNPAATGKARGGGAGDYSIGCQFDILEFEHIGDCKGTCDDQSESIRFDLGSDEEGGNIVIVEIDMDDPEAMARLEKLIKQGKIRPMTEEETQEIMGKLMSGELDVEIKKMSLSEFLDIVEQPEPEDDPYLDVKQAAEALGFSLGWTRTLCRKGRLPGAIKLMRKWAIPRSAIFEED